MLRRKARYLWPNSATLEKKLSLAFIVAVAMIIAIDVIKIVIDILHLNTCLKLII